MGLEEWQRTLNSREFIENMRRFKQVNHSIATLLEPASQENKVLEFQVAIVQVETDGF